MSSTERAGSEHWFESQPDWFRTAVFYELHTRAFFDSSDDGTGDFRGLRQKLDYLEWLEVWFITKSAITRIRRSCAASTNAANSSTVPNSGATLRKSATS